MKHVTVLLLIASTLAFARPNDPPLITDVRILSLPFQPNQRTLVVEAYDPDRDPISFLVTSATRGVDVFPQGDRFQIHFPDGSRSVDISVIVSDGRGGSSQQRWDLLSSNQAPIIHKFDTTIDFADNGEAGSLIANAVDPDGDALDYVFEGLSKHHQLVDIIKHSQRDGSFLANIRFHEHERGSVRLVFEVSDRRGGVSKAIIPVRVGKLLRKIGRWDMSAWSMTATGMDIDRDGNVYVVRFGPLPAFVGLDMKGNFIRGGVLQGVSEVWTMAIDRDDPQQPFLVSENNLQQRVHLNDFLSGTILGQWPMPGLVTALLPLPNDETLISIGNGPVRDLLLRDAAGNLTQFSNLYGADIKQMSRDDVTGDIYAVDRIGEVRVYDANGSLLRIISGPTTPFNQPQGMLFDSQEDVLIVSDTKNRRIQMLDPVTGAHHQTYTEASLSFEPRAIVKQPNGQILFLNFPRQSIEVFVLD